jgi:CRP-like cAMP-binding protein
MPRRVFRGLGEIRGCLRATLAAHLDEAHLERLARTTRPLSFAHGEQLWARGDVGTVAYVLEGAFDVIHNDVIVDTIGPRQFLGLSSLWGSPHSAEVRARRTEKDRSPQVLLWDTSDSETRDLFCSVGMLKMLLCDAQGLIHHLNELQVLHRRKRGAVAHVASHMRRLARCHESGMEVEIGQRELGALAGYDQRTVRLALGELTRAQCIGRLRRSAYRVNVAALTEFIEKEKLGDLEIEADPEMAQGTSSGVANAMDP